MTPAEPLHRSPFARARWLVLAPHADDETLGTAALIADAAARDRLGAVVFLTDGSGSHPCPTPADRTRLVRRRRAEARRALGLLTGSRAMRPLFLDWQDAHPPANDSAAFARSARALATLMRRCRIDAVATTAHHEPHRDHAACHRLAVRAVALARRRIALFDYIVWGTPRPGFRTLRTPPILAGRRTAALIAHRSQLGGSPEGFRVPASMRRMPATDLLYPVNPHAKP